MYVRCHHYLHCVHKKFNQDKVYYKEYNVTVGGGTVKKGK